MGICLCSAQAGYPHAWDCPRPLYRATDEQADQWLYDREQVRRRNDRHCGRRDQTAADTRAFQAGH